MTATVIHLSDAAYRRGRRLYRDGKPRPPVSARRDGAVLHIPPVSKYVWLGWMMERAKALVEAEKRGNDPPPSAA